MKKSVAVIIAVLSFLVGIGVGHIISPLLSKLFIMNSKKAVYYKEYEDENSEMNLGGNIRYEQD